MGRNSTIENGKTRKYQAILITMEFYQCIILIIIVSKNVQTIFYSDNSNQFVFLFYSLVSTHVILMSLIKYHQYNWGEVSKTSV